MFCNISERTEKKLINFLLKQMDTEKIMKISIAANFFQ